MSDPTRIRRQQILRHAEGYLELIQVFSDRWPCRADVRDALALRAVDMLRQIDNPGGLKGSIRFLEGQAFKIMERHAEAIPPLCEAAQAEPQNVHIQLALAWCYKRTRRLDLAIESLESALTVDGNLAIAHYNLACYWSLAGNVKLAVSYLAQAFELEPDYRDRVAGEPDFDAVRSHPYFQHLTALVV